MTERFVDFLDVFSQLLLAYILDCMIWIFIGVFIVGFLYLTKIRKYWIKQTHIDEAKIIRYLCKCIVDCYKNEEMVPKCKHVIEIFSKYLNTPSQNKRCTPFQVACSYGVEEIISYMLKMGANANMKAPKNQSTFFLATNGLVKRNSNNFNILNILLKEGVSINEPSEHGITPLMIAAVYGKDELVKWLLAHGADPLVRNNDLLPWKMAFKAGHESTAALLYIKTDDEEDLDRSRNP